MNSQTSAAARNDAADMQPRKAGASSMTLASTLSEIPHEDTRRLMNVILSSLEDSKAEDVVTIPLEPGAALADAMIIASGRSNRHVAAIAEHLMEDMKKAGFRQFSVEGLEHADWVLVDAGDVIVHIFRPEVREFYNLEKLWAPHARAAGNG